MPFESRIERTFLTTAVLGLVPDSFIGAAAAYVAGAAFLPSLRGLDGWRRFPFELPHEFGVHDCRALVPQGFLDPHIGEFALVVPDAAIEAILIPAGPYLPVLFRRKELLF